AQLNGNLVLGPDHIEYRQAPEYWEDQGSFPYLVTQFSRSAVGMLYFRNPIAPRRNQRRPKRDLQHEFVSVAFRSRRERLEELQGRSDMIDCFYIRRALTRSFARPLPVGKGV